MPMSEVTAMDAARPSGLGTRYRIRDLRAFLSGTWRIARRIGDRRLGVIGRLEGVASFAPAARGLRYDEVGTLEFSTYRGRVTQRYVFDIDDAAATGAVHFADGRLFHIFDLSTGVADVAHDCGADRYRGRYRMFCADGWALVWNVAGPRKRLSIATRYSRASPGRNRPHGRRPTLEDVDCRPETCANPPGWDRLRSLPLNGDLP
jgi:hypothetical protein